MAKRKKAGKKPVLAYLCGPVTGMTFEKASELRNRVEKRLAPHNIRCINPMRALTFLRGGGPISGTGREYKDTAIANPKTIIALNMWDVCRSDLLIIILIGATRVSVGSVAEEWTAFSVDKPLAAALDPKEGNPHDHLHVTSIIDLKTYSIEELCDKVIADLTGPRKKSLLRRTQTKKEKQFLKETKKKFKQALKEQGLMKTLKKLEKESIKRFEQLRKRKGT